MPPVTNFFAFKFTGPDDWGWTRRPSFVTVTGGYTLAASDLALCYRLTVTL